MRTPLGARAMVAAVVALAACTGAEARADNRVTLRFWAMGAEADALSSLVRGFEREHPEIRVQIQPIPWTAAHEKLMTAFVGDATPDLTQLGNTWIPEFTAIGALQRLDSMAAHAPAVDSADYFQGVWDTNVIHGALYGIPWYVDTRLLFYRTDILAAAGYDSMPGSWSGWRKAMEAVQRHEAGQPRRWPIFLPTNEWNQPVIFGMQNGSTLLKDDGRYGDFSDSSFRSAFEFYVSLYRDRLAPIAGVNDMANPYQEFARGTFAMWITGPWNIGEFKRRLPDSLQQSWATAPIPGPEGDASGISLAGGASFAIFRASRHKAAAWQLIQYLSQPAQQLAFYRLSGDLPSRLDAWRASGLETDRYARAFWVQLHRVRATPKVPEWESITAKIIDQAEESIRGGVAPATSLLALDQDVNTILDKRRWIMARDSAGAVGHAP
ncbi:MAG TPA: sugar ABC transporter substrate-binding protein [Gemmatimonadaceae bacterium]|nr:sugar ABC transporter substrate-binding protein [Gemmatimonadaceae bacterium]